MTIDWASYNFHSPPDPLDVKLSGYPPGFTPADWLTGAQAAGKPFDGVVRAALNGGISGEAVDLNGIHGAHFADCIFDTYVRPSNVELPGFFMGISLREAIEQIMNAYIELKTDVDTDTYPEPVYWLGATVSPADMRKIVPQFRALDMTRL
jgi:hypothetical protein